MQYGESPFQNMMTVAVFKSKAEPHKVYIITGINLNCTCKQKNPQKNQLSEIIGGTTSSWMMSNVSALSRAWMNVLIILSTIVKEKRELELCAMVW